MAKVLSKLYIRILISLAVGFLLTGAFVNIQYPCTEVITIEELAPGEDISKCIAFEDAIMHPSDLLSNKQDSLTRFVANITLSSLVIFSLLSLYSNFKTKKKTQT